MRMISGLVNFYAWILILFPIWWSLALAQKLLELETWGPFVGTVFFLTLTLINFRTMTAPRQPEADGLGSSLVR